MDSVEKNMKQRELILYYLIDSIALLDNTCLSTIMVDKAIKRLKEIKHVRKHLPF